MNNDKRELKINNKGFTLVEVLIAVIVLAIIVVPLLNLFIRSASMNQTSKRRLAVTSIAEDIMEGIKSRDIEEITKEFNYPETFKLANLPGEGYELTQLKNNGSGNYESLAPGNPGTVKYDETKDVYELQKEKDAGNSYYYCIKNIKPVKESYDALIRIDASPYAEGGSAKYLFNDQEAIDAESLGVHGKAKHFQSMNLDENACKDLKTKIMTALKDYPDFETKDLDRNIQIEINKDGNKINVNIVYEYSLDVLGKTYKIPYSYNLHDLDEADFENLYIFYYPKYETASGKETIEISNMKDVPVNLFLLKQESSLSQTSSVYEERYKVTVKVKETTKPEPVTRLITNINDNISYRYDPSSREHIDQGKFYYNGNGNPDVIEKLVTEPGNGKKSDRYFDVSISMYLSSEITGYTFPEDDESKIYEITGSTQE